MMKTNSVAVLALGCIFAAQASARDVVDMIGRKVTIPDHVTKVYAPSPYGANLMYVLAPEAMAGLISPVKESDKKFLPKALQDLQPFSVGGAPRPPAGPGGPDTPGGGPRPAPNAGESNGAPKPPANAGARGPDPAVMAEAYRKAGVQLLIILRPEPSPVTEKTTANYDKMGIPYLFVNATTLEEFPVAMRFIGQVVGDQKRIEKKARLVEKILSDAQKAANRTPQEKRPKVYYAEGADGLATECDDSMHAQVLRAVGDVNVNRCHNAGHAGMEKMPLEKLIALNPDIIVAQDGNFAAKVYDDPAWAQIKAVRDHRVYRIPRAPINWFDRPPTVMRFAGVQWMTEQLYAKNPDVSIARKTKKLYKAFLDVKLSDADVKEILGQ